MPSRRQEFLNAVKTGNVAVMEKLLRENPSLAGARDDSGVSALLLAQYSNRSDVVTLFLTYKPELDAFETASLGLSARFADLFKITLPSRLKSCYKFRRYA